MCKRYNVTINHYRNKRNANKYVEVRHYKCGHYSCRQYMMWDNGVKNVLGSRTGRLFRWRKKFLNDLLEDYVEVE